MTRRLPDPIKDALRDPLADIDAEHVLRQLHERPRPSSPGRRPAGERWRWVALPTLVLAGLAAFLLMPFDDDAPLDELPLGTLIHPDDAAVSRRLSLSDGSSMELSPGTEALVRVNDGDSVELAMARGRVRFDINPSGRRNWSVDCGAAVVEVVGTIFSVDQRPESTGISVERGRVRVRGSGLPGGSIELSRGKQLFLVVVPGSGDRASRIESFDYGSIEP